MPDASAPPDRAPLRLLFRRKGWAGQRVHVQLAHGPALGQFDLSVWGRGAEITLPTGVFEVRKDPDGALVLYGQGLPLAQAVRSGVLKVRYHVEWPGGAGDLRPGSFWGNRFVLEADGVPVAVMTRSSWQFRIEGTFPRDWPIERALFVGAVAILEWTMNDAAAAS